MVLGHSRLITNGLENNQPVFRDDISLLHNGIILNYSELWESIDIQIKFEIDSEIIIGLALDHIKKQKPIESVAEYILSKCSGVMNCALLFHNLGKLILFSNNGSLYIGMKENNFHFASEKNTLKLIECSNIRQLINEKYIIDVTKSSIIKNLDNKKKDQANPFIA